MKLVIGVGNPDRGDDAVGLAVARRIREASPRGVTIAELDGDQLALLDTGLLDTGLLGTGPLDTGPLGTGRRTAEVYVVDAVRSGSRPGTVYRFDALHPVGARFRQRGTHTLGLAEVIELARALHRLPARLVGYGIEGATFALGAGLSPEAEAASQMVASRLLGELTEDG